MTHLAKIRATGYVPQGELNVSYDGQQWYGPECKRYMRADGHRFVAEKLGPGCWRLTARKDGVEVLRKLCPDLNAAKKRAAVFLRTGT